MATSESTIKSHQIGSFQYASPHVWNQLPVLRYFVNQFHLSTLISTHLSLLYFLHPSLLHSKLKIYLVGKSFPP